MSQKKLVFITLLWFISLLVLSGCKGASETNTVDVIEDLGVTEDTEKTAEEAVEEQNEETTYEQMVVDINEQIGLEPIQLTTYSEEVGAVIQSPLYKKFAANGKVVVEGEVERHAELKSDHAWIKVVSKDGGPAGKEHEYFSPIVNGKFHQDIQLFNGEGEYRVTVQLPSLDRENYYYDTAIFEVVNVNPEIKRDISYTHFGQKAELSLDLESSYVIRDGVFLLEGTSNLSDTDTIMIVLKKKGSKSWKHTIPVKNGAFSYQVPLFFGEGLHELEVLVPDENRDNYYQNATVLLIDNESTSEMEPISFFETTLKRGVTLEYPMYGGEKAEETYRVTGTIDPDAEFAAETTHLYITTKLGQDTALEVIPVENYQFDSSFFLRFGPGTYKVTVSVPEIKEQNSSYFRYYNVAEFEVESSGEDQRNLLPARGIQSDSLRIIELAKQITEGIEQDFDKAKAIYEYVAKTVAYDVEKFRTSDFHWDDSALKTLDLKTGVCQDYAYLAIALLRASEIESRFVEGYARGRHAWVEFLDNGNWITMDPTWGAGYIKNNVFVAEYTEEYFNPDPAEFEKTHKRTGVAY